MEIAGSPDIFQERLSNLIQHLDHEQVYLESNLQLTKDFLHDHMNKLESYI